MCSPVHTSSSHTYTHKRIYTHARARSHALYRALPTDHTRLLLSVYPVKSVLPSEDHARHVQYGSMEFLPSGGKSGLSSSTTDLDSRSQILTHCCVAAHSQYLFGEKHSE